MFVIFALPWAAWRALGGTSILPLVVVQIITGILLGPAVLGHFFPAYYQFVFNPSVVQSLNGVAWWAVMLFVFIAGIELDLSQAWASKKESSLTAGLALLVPLIFGAAAASFINSGLMGTGWMGALGILTATASASLEI